MVWILVRLALVLVGLALAFTWVWHLARTRRVTVLVCPRCGGRTAFGPSRPYIDCRRCRAPLRRGGTLAAGVRTEVVYPTGRGD